MCNPQTPTRKLYCLYCEHFKINYLGNDNNYFLNELGFCKVKNSYLPICENICEEFVIKSGLYLSGYNFNRFE